MSIQKITNISSGRTKNLFIQKMQFAESKTERNDASVKKLNVGKNNLPGEVSFKGRESIVQVQKPAKRFEYQSSPVYKREELCEITLSDFSHSGYNVHKGSGGYIEQTPERARASIYYADGGEQLTNLIFQNSLYVLVRPEDEGKPIKFIVPQASSEDSYAKRNKELISDIDENAIMSAVDSDTLRKYIQELETKREKITKQINSQKYKEEENEWQHKAVRNEYENAYDEYDMAESDEAKKSAEYYINEAQYRLSCINVELESLLNFTKWLKKQSEDNLSKLELAKARLEVITQTEQAYKKKHPVLSFFKNILQKKSK